MQRNDIVHSYESRFQLLVDSFKLKKPGAHPFEADLLDSQCERASQGEKASITFLLNVWNPSHPWKAGKFDVMDALEIWDIARRKAFVEWACNPFWP